MLEKIQSVERSTSAIPVAQPAAPRGPVATSAVPAPEDESLITPTNVKSWATSLAAHALLLLCFALWVFTPPRNEAKSFDTRIGGDAGSSGSGGEDTGSLKSLGIQEAELSFNPPSTTPETPAPLSELDPGSVVLDPTAQRKAAVSKNGQQGGVNLPNPGSGGSGEGFGLAKFGSGTESIGGVGVKVGDPQFTLIWDTQADIDLHVIEPGGAEIYWEIPHGNKGGELDVDDIDGFGPENVYWVQGNGPPGEYKWFVHYYGGLAGVPVATRWKVRVKHAGKVTVYQGKLNTVGARSKMHSLTLDRLPGDPASETPAAKAPAH